MATTIVSQRDAAGHLPITTLIKRLLAHSLFAALFLAQSAQSQLPDDVVARIQEIVNEVVAQSATTGASVAVVAEGRIIASVGAGFADTASGRKVTPETIFPAASVSKLITATLVMRQVERGRLELDRPANDYLEPAYWIRDSAGEPVAATLRQLLTHSSGLPVSFSKSVETMPDGNVRSLTQYLGEGLQTIRAPGQKLIYSNEGFALLGFLAAQAEKEEFEDHVQRVLLRPLGMPDSSFEVRNEMRPRLAILYGEFFDDSARIEPMDISAIGPAGSLHTTADDLARFALLHLGEGSFDGVRIVSKESVQEMMRLQASQHPSQPDGFGLGFGVLNDPQRRMVWWDGGLPGVSSRLALLPDYGVAVAILTNSANPLPVQAISQRIFDLLLGPVQRPIIPIDETVNEVIGEYRLIDMVEPSMWYVKLLPVLAITVEDNSLRLGSPFFEDAVTLQPLGMNQYRVTGVLFDGATALIEDGHLYLHMIEAERVSPWGSSTALFVYVTVLAVLVLALIGFGIFRLIRRIRART